MSRDAWVTLLLQGVRIFVLARVTPKSFGSLPGVLLPVARAAKGKDGKDGPAKPATDPELVDSNVYSVSEGIVLKWLGYHVNATTPASALPRITNAEEAFRTARCSATCSRRTCPRRRGRRHARWLHAHDRPKELEDPETA